MERRPYRARLDGARGFALHIAVVGGGIAGLGGALALARDGHAVTLLERDATPMPATPDEAFDTWERRGAPQVRHSHAFLARLRNLLADRVPDVLDALLEAGATELRFCDQLPETLLDRAPRPGDEELVALACRRTTFEWVLRRRVLAEPAVALRDGVAVDGLLAGPGIPTRVHGVRGRDTSGQALEVPADLVLDASGPRSAGREWLAEVGVELPPDEVHPCGIVYLSRFYRLGPEAEPPPLAGPVAVDLGYVKYALFVGDNRTFSVTLAVPTDDAELRALTDVTRFERAARALPPAAPWLDGRADAITEVHVMAGLRNRKRRFVVDGEPLVLGFAAVGDASVCTNPLYGRGCSLALVHAFALADARRDHPADPAGFARALDAATTRELDPWYRNAVFQDEQSRALAGDLGADAADDATPDAAGDVDPQAFLRAVLREGFVPALRTDATVFRAFLRWFNLLAPPETLVSDPEVVAAVMASYQAREGRAPEPPAGPDRAALLAAVRGA